MLNKIIYRFGALLCNNKIFQHFNKLKQQEALSLRELESLQLRRVIGLLNFSYKYSPFIKRKLDEAGFRPTDLTCLNDLKKIPLTTKSESLEFN